MDYLVLWVQVIKTKNFLFLSGCQKEKEEKCLYSPGSYHLPWGCIANICVLSHVMGKLNSQEHHLWNEC